MIEIKRITNNGELLAIIIPANYQPDGIEFITEPKNTIQLAAMRHKSGHLIKPHVHNIVKRTVFYTQEVLIVRRGRVRVDLYTPDKEYLESHILSTGDVILLAKGGHGFKILEDLDMVEVKQGPFIGDHDKTRFENNNSAIKIRD